LRDSEFSFKIEHGRAGAAEGVGEAEIALHEGRTRLMKRQGRRVRFAALGIIASAIIGLLAILPAWAAGTRFRPREGASTPIVTLAGTAPAARAIEARMARFILSLQANDRIAAARLLSRRVSPGYRRAFRAGKWLTRGSTRDFALIYFLPAIRLQARDISRTRALVRVAPLTPYAPREMPIGFLDVPMVYETGRWQVNPAPTAVRQAQRR
jgi:hypothetical protein